MQDITTIIKYIVAGNIESGSFVTNNIHSFLRELSYVTLQFFTSENGQVYLLDRDGKYPLGSDKHEPENLDSILENTFKQIMISDTTNHLEHTIMNGKFEIQTTNFKNHEKFFSGILD